MTHNINPTELIRRTRDINSQNYILQLHCHRLTTTATGPRRRHRLAAAAAAATPRAVSRSHRYQLAVLIAVICAQFGWIAFHRVLWLANLNCKQLSDEMPLAEIGF